MTAELLTEHPEVAVLPFHEMTRGMWQYHTCGQHGKPDCTHLCDGGPPWRDLWARLGSLIVPLGEKQQPS